MPIILSFVNSFYALPISTFWQLPSVLHVCEIPFFPQLLMFPLYFCNCPHFRPPSLFPISIYVPFTVIVCPFMYHLHQDPLILVPFHFWHIFLLFLILSKLTTVFFVLIPQYLKIFWLFSTFCIFRTFYYANEIQKKPQVSSKDGVQFMNFSYLSRSYFWFYQKGVYFCQVTITIPCSLRVCKFSFFRNTFCGFFSISQVEMFSDALSISECFSEQLHILCLLFKFDITGT